MQTNSLYPSDWHKNIRPVLRGEVEKVMEKESRGYRLLPYESTVAELVHLLDKYDEEYAKLMAYNSIEKTIADPFRKSPKKQREERETLQPAMGGSLQLAHGGQADSGPAGD